MIDATGNMSQVWVDPVPKAVQGWDILTSEVLPAHQVEEKFQMYLMVPPTFWPTIRDRFSIPVPQNGMQAPTEMFDSSGAVSAGIFEVVGHDIENHGFTGWALGNIILCREVFG